jgi:hypothetical protein
MQGQREWPDTRRLAARQATSLRQVCRRLCESYWFLEVTPIPKDLLGRSAVDYLYPACYAKQRRAAPNHLYSPCLRGDRCVHRNGQEGVEPFRQANQLGGHGVLAPQPGCAPGSPSGTLNRCADWFERGLAPATRCPAARGNGFAPNRLVPDRRCQSTSAGCQPGCVLRSKYARTSPNLALRNPSHETVPP